MVDLAEGAGADDAAEAEAGAVVARGDGLRDRLELANVGGARARVGEGGGHGERRSSTCELSRLDSFLEEVLLGRRRPG